MVNGNTWPGLHLVKLSPAGVPPVLILTAMLDADTGACEFVLAPAPGVEQFIAGEAVARLGLKGDRITHALRGEGGRRIPAEVAPLLRRVPPLVRAGGDLVDAVMTAVERHVHAEKSAAWREGYAAAVEELTTSRPFYEFMGRLNYTRPHLRMVPDYVKGEATKADAAGGGEHGGA
jgi:hypothetical protein